MKAWLDTVTNMFGGFGCFLGYLCLACRYILSNPFWIHVGDSIILDVLITNQSEPCVPIYWGRPHESYYFY